MRRPVRRVEVAYGLVTLFTQTITGHLLCSDRKPWEEGQAGGGRQKPKKDVSAHPTCVYPEMTSGSKQRPPCCPKERE